MGRAILYLGVLTLRMLLLSVFFPYVSVVPGMFQGQGREVGACEHGDQDARVHCRFAEQRVIGIAH